MWKTVREDIKITPEQRKAKLITCFVLLIAQSLDNKDRVIGVTME